MVKNCMKDIQFAPSLLICKLKFPQKTSTDLKIRLPVTEKLEAKEHAHSLGWNVNYNLF